MKNLKNKAIGVLITAIFVLCTIPALSGIKSFLKACPLRPVMNRDLVALKPILEAFIYHNDKKYPKVAYVLPKMKNLFLIKGDFDKFSAAFLKEAGISYQDLIVDHEIPQEAKGGSFNAIIETGRNAFILPANFTNANSLSIKNISGVEIADMSFTLNGKDWSSIDAILSAIISTHMSDKDKAFAIWRVLKDNIVHFDPPDRGAFSHDPVTLLNITGYGICDDAAISFAVLARRAGLKARVWGLTGHVTAEAFYDGTWHMFDPDQGIYYLTLDDKKVAGVLEISKDPARIIGRTEETKFKNKDRFIKVYGSMKDNRIIDKICAMPSYYRKIRFNLLPNEEIVFQYRKRGPWYAKDSWLKPPVVGSVIDKIELSNDETFASVQRSGMELKNGALTNSTAGSYIIWFHELPYPILDIRMAYELIAQDESVAGAIEIFFSKDGKNWKKAGAFEASSSTISLKRLIDNFNSEPNFKYFVKVIFMREGLSIEGLRSEAEAQANPSGPFKLNPGENIIEIRADGKAVLNLAVNYNVES